MNKKWQIYETDTEETKRIAEKYKINERGNIRTRHHPNFPLEKHQIF